MRTRESNYCIYYNRLGLFTKPATSSVTDGLFYRVVSQVEFAARLRYTTLDISVPVVIICNNHRTGRASCQS
jgi:hypothetical protein